VRSAQRTLIKNHNRHQMRISDGNHAQFVTQNRRIFTLAKNNLNNLLIDNASREI